jgi:predicted RNA-binding Zn ribbon-like protein
MSSSDAALLLRDFVNTRNIEDATDDIASPRELTGWLTERGLLAAASGPAGGTDVACAQSLREGLRIAMLNHHAHAEVQELPAELAAALERLPLCVSMAVEPPALTPAQDGVTGALARLAGAVMVTVADGSWPRLKVCLEANCRWAFVDTSKNRSRSWCSMRVCGNRTKTRNYRARHRTGA